MTSKAPARFGGKSANERERMLFRRWCFCLLLLVTISMACGAERPSKQYSTEDSVVIDRGVFSYFPRYRIQLPPLPVAQPVSQVFELGDLPTKRFSLRLVVDPEQQQVLDDEEVWAAFLNELVGQEISLAVSLIDAKSREPVVVFGGSLPGDWYPVRMGERFFTADVFDRVELPSRGRIKIEISIGNPSPNDSLVTIQPVLVGGGFKV